MTVMKRTLGLAECVFFGVGSILGAGIYTLLGKVAGWSGNFIWLAFIIASFTALCTAFSYAELSAAFPKAGGEYVYASKAFGKKTGIFLGCIISFNGIVSGATVSLGFAGYLSGLVGIGVTLAALGIIGVIFLVNVSGIRQSSIVNIVFTLIEFGGLVFVLTAGIRFIGRVDFLEVPPEGINGLLAASALAFYSYIGFEDTVKLAEETKNPARVIPRALFIICGIVILIYTLVALVAVSAIDHTQLAESASPMADIVKSAYGRTGIVAISIVALFSTSNTILSNMIGSSRILLKMGKENNILKRLSYLSGRGVPVGALILILVIMSGFALIGEIELIARISTTLIFLTFIVINLSVILLRFSHPQLKRPYRISWSVRHVPVFSALGILLTLILLGYNVYSLVYGEKA